jgi:hypothetical protein
MGDSTAHGGVIVMGCFTVLIGTAGSGGAGTGGQGDGGKSKPGTDCTKKAKSSGSGFAQ